VLIAWLPVLLIGGLPSLATVFGGTLALRFRSALGLLLGFSSGAVIGVALFDLLPEALEIGRSHYRALTITTALGVGFAAYLGLDRLSLILKSEMSGHRHLGPLSLTLHSLTDGLSIGLAFQASSKVGLVVALAVIAHDFLDGANTVTLSLAGGLSTPIARRWLLADAAAPIAGIVLSLLLTVPPSLLALLLATFAGFFLYIGTSELLPRSNAGRPRIAMLAATAFGLLFIYAVVRLAAL
jgi:ZIP family zinc transporter